MKKRKTERFQFNIIKISAVLVLAVASSLLAVFYLGTSRIVLQMADQVTDEISQNVIHLSENFLNKSATYTSMVASFATDLVGDDHDAIVNHEAIWQELWQFLIETPSLQSFFLADPEGSYVQVRREPRLATRIIDRSGDEPIEKWFYRDLDYNIVGTKTKVPTFDPRIRPWYKVTGTEPHNYWSKVYVFTTAQTPGIAVTHPILNSRGELAAVVCGNTPLHALSSFVARQEVSENGLVFIVSNDGELIAFPDASKTTVKDKATGKLRLGHVDDLETPWIQEAYRAFARSGSRHNTFSVDGETYISNVFPFPGAFSDRWNIVVALPEADILGRVKELFWLSLVIGLLIAATSLGAIYFVSRAISHQIVKLTGQMAYLSSFELERIRGVDSHIQEIQIMNEALMKAVTTIASFAKYVPAQLVRQLIQRGEEIRIGGKSAELTLMFTDVEGFAGIAEQMESDQVMVHLSEYFDHLTRIVRAEKGTVDKYIGDSLMAFWGQPLPLPDAPYRACKAALLCVAELETLNREWAEQGKAVMKTRFGLHTGVVTVGNMGSKDRINYSAVGDNVNIASRLEGLNRVYGTSVVISASTYEAVKDRFLCRPLDRLRVKGRSESIRIYELVAERGDAMAADLERFYQQFERAYEAREQGDCTRALAILDTIDDLCPGDGPSRVLRDGCHREG
jgi:adenylate cyclase